jgi:hypothetical protein
MYKFSNALKSGYFNSDKKAWWDKEQQESIIIVPLARSLARCQDFFSSTHARTQRGLASLADRSAAQHKARLSEREALLHRFHSTSDPTVITPFSFQINGKDWKHMHIF